jgi:hypothetical protein
VSEDASETLAKGLIGAIGAAIHLATLPIEAVAIARMWGWFLVPVGLRPITAATGLGLSVMVAIVTYRYTDTSDDPFWPLKAAVGNLCCVLVGWGAGFALHLLGGQ